MPANIKCQFIFVDQRIFNSVADWIANILALYCNNLAHGMHEHNYIYTNRSKHKPS